MLRWIDSLDRMLDEGAPALLAGLAVAVAIIRLGEVMSR